MDHLRTEGESIFGFSIGAKYGDIALSVISNRAFPLILRQCLKNKWKRPVSQLSPPIFLPSANLLIRGYQPETNLFIATKKFRK